VIGSEEKKKTNKQIRITSSSPNNITESKMAGSARAHYIRAPPFLLPSIPLHNYGIAKIIYKTTSGGGAAAAVMLVMMVMMMMMMIPSRGKIFLLSTFSGLYSLLSNGHRGLFYRGVKLIIHF
jgi:hypothetical protein